MAVTLGQQNLSIPKNGLVLHLDAANTASYPGSGTTWYDLSGRGNNFNIVATAYNSSGVKYMDFNGSYGCAKASAGVDVEITNNSGGDVTYVAWTRVLNNSANWRTLTRALSSGGDHHIIIQSGGWGIGMYDNTNGSGFNNTGYSQQSLPNYGTANWCMMVWRFSNNAVAPYYRLSINNSTAAVGSIASVNAAFKQGICSLGAHNNGDQTNLTNASQYWGDIGMFAAYNRQLTDGEVIQCYNAGAPRFMGATQMYENTITYSDGTVQTVAYPSNADSGKLLQIDSYTAANTGVNNSYQWVKPAGCTKVYVIVTGGGGGAASYCESGGAGGHSEMLVDITNVSTVPVTVGAGGGAVGYYAGAGAGGTSSFGSYCSASGGYGANNNVAHTGGHGGIGSNGDLNIWGGVGTGHGNTGGREAVGRGASSYWGGPQRASHSTNSPVGTAAPGTGGTGGAMQSWVGSPGATGMVVVYSYA
jgi:hypothetical protein